MHTFGTRDGGKTYEVYCAHNGEVLEVFSSKQFAEEYVNYLNGGVYQEVLQSLIQSLDDIAQVISAK